MYKSSSRGVVVSTVGFKPSDYRFKSWSRQVLFTLFFILKMRQKVSLCMIEFSERERRIILGLLSFSY